VVARKPLRVGEENSGSFAMKLLKFVFATEFANERNIILTITGRQSRRRD